MKKTLDKRDTLCYTLEAVADNDEKQTTWGISAVGSAFEWHSKGQGFDSPMLHHFNVLRIFFARHFICRCDGIGRRAGLKIRW